MQFEQTLQADEHVAEAVVFGVGQVCAGLIIVPAEGLDSLSEDDYLRLIQPTIDAANAQAEAHAKVGREHVRVLKANAADDCPKTDKGTVIRAAFYKKFEALIESVYEDAERASAAQLQLDFDETVGWLKQLLFEILRLEPTSAGHVADDSDFFALGLDSLGAYRMYSRIMRALDLGSKAADVTGNVCFEYPSLRSLASYLSALRSGAAYSKRSETAEMQALIGRYGTFACPTSQEAGSPRVVLLTGATGSLGAHILAALLRDPAIEKVYCLNRGAEPQARTLESLEARGVRAATERVVSFSADLSKPGFGLPDGSLRGVNLVIHNAWSVNFNMGVASFEHHIRGARNLLDFSFAANARYFFVSSVSAAVRSGVVIPEAHLAQLSDAQEMGYARSKLVGERLCLHAKRAGLDARVLRVGQIVGDTQHGQWNATEAIPLMIRSAISIGALPMLNDTLTWLPIDVVAQAMVEICRSGKRHEVYHVVSPKSFHWTRDFLPMLASAGLEFEQVAAAEWLQRLASSNPDPALNPTIKLLEFFKAKYEKPRTSSTVVFETKISESVSESLTNVRALDAALVAKMVQYWTTQAWT